MLGCSGCGWRPLRVRPAAPTAVAMGYRCLRLDDFCILHTTEALPRNSLKAHNELEVFLGGIGVQTSTSMAVCAPRVVYGGVEDRRASNRLWATVCQRLSHFSPSPDTTPSCDPLAYIPTGCGEG